MCIVGTSGIHVNLLRALLTLASVFSITSLLTVGRLFNVMQWASMMDTIW